MDFSAWFEVWLDGRWFTFDARHNTPRIGRILMATGRDATDVAISTSFGTSTLAGFRVVTDEVPYGAPHALPGSHAENGVHHHLSGRHAARLPHGRPRRGATNRCRRIPYSQPRILKTQ